MLTSLVRNEIIRILKKNKIKQFQMLQMLKIDHQLQCHQIKSSLLSLENKMMMWQVIVVRMHQILHLQIKNKMDRINPIYLLVSNHLTILVEIKIKIPFKEQQMETFHLVVEDYFRLILPELHNIGMYLLELLQVKRVQGTFDKLIIFKV